MSYLLDFFRPVIAKRAGQMLAAAAAAPLSATASATVSSVIALPRTTCAVQSFSLVALVAAAGSAAITVTVNKVNGATVVPLTAAISLTSSTITAVGNFALPLLSTLSNQNRVIDGSVGDFLRVDVIAAGTVTTNVTASVVAEFGFSK